VTSWQGLLKIKGTPNAQVIFLCHMSINHGRLDINMPEQLLNGGIS